MCHPGSVGCYQWDSSGGDEEVPAQIASIWIYPSDLSAQQRVDKSLLTGEEELPLVICKRGTAAIREERLRSTGSRNSFQERWIWCEVLMKNVLGLFSTGS